MSYSDFSPERPASASVILIGSPVSSATVAEADRGSPCGILSVYKIPTLIAVQILNAFLLLLSLLGADGGLTVLAINTQVAATRLSISYFMNGATVCQTSGGQTICADVTSALPASGSGSFYSSDFIAAAQAMEGLVATAAALSCLVALSFAVLACTSPRILLLPSESPALQGRLAWVGYPQIVYAQLTATTLFAGIGVVTLAAAATQMLEKASVSELAWVTGEVAFGPSFALAATGAATSLATAAFLVLA